MSDLRCPKCWEQIPCDCDDARCRICNRELDVAALQADRDICSFVTFSMSKTDDQSIDSAAGTAAAWWASKEAHSRPAGAAPDNARYGIAGGVGYFRAKGVRPHGRFF
jgi:hypothetical protein